MLNRKFTNYIFYFIIVAVLAVVYIIRTLMLGGLQDRIDVLDNENARLQSQIVNLEQTVEENRDFDQTFLYELYHEIPNEYNETQVVYDTNALLELAGITLAPEVMRSVVIRDDVSIPEGSPVSQLANNYMIVEITVYFNTNDILQINELIDVLEESNQLYLISVLNYSFPIEDERVPIELSYYAFYDVE